MPFQDDSTPRNPCERGGGHGTFTAGKVTCWRRRVGGRDQKTKGPTQSEGNEIRLITLREIKSLSCPHPLPVKIYMRHLEEKPSGTVP